jgi:hypothetical protein
MNGVLLPAGIPRSNNQRKREKNKTTQQKQTLLVSATTRCEK